MRTTIWRGRVTSHNSMTARKIPIGRITSGSLWLAITALTGHLTSVPAHSAWNCGWRHIDGGWSWAPRCLRWAGRWQTAGGSPNRRAAQNCSKQHDTLRPGDWQDHGRIPCLCPAGLQAGEIIQCPDSGQKEIGAALHNHKAAQIVYT